MVRRVVCVCEGECVFVLGREIRVCRIMETIYMCFRLFA